MDARFLSRTVFLLALTGVIGCFREEPAAEPDGGGDTADQRLDGGPDDGSPVDDAELEEVDAAFVPESDGLQEADGPAPDAEGSVPVTTDSGTSGPDVAPEDALDGSGGYAGQCEPYPVGEPPAPSEGWSIDDLNRQCRYVTGCNAPAWSPRFECPPWLLPGQEWICGYCWNELCIDLADNVCPEPPYGFIENPSLIEECAMPILRNRSAHSSAVVAALDRVCAVAVDCALARTPGCHTAGAEFEAYCELCWQGRCESIVWVSTCGPGSDDGRP